jgi:hypothetical protein
VNVVVFFVQKQEQRGGSHDHVRHIDGARRMDWRRDHGHGRGHGFVCRRQWEAPVSCQSNKLRELRGEQYTPNDCPRMATLTSCWKRYGFIMARRADPISNRFRAPQ